MTEETKPIVITPKVYKTIILYCSRFANQSILRSEWKEVYGILTGFGTEDVVSVKDAYPLTSGHSTEVVLQPEHYVKISEIQDRLDNLGEGHHIVGWFHSHPGLGLFYSETDLINHLSFQTAFSDAVGIVFDHTMLGKYYEKVINESAKVKEQHTGMTAYRIVDVEMQQNDPRFENNYEEVDIIVEGLGKAFFADVMMELASRYSEGKTIQSAYQEGEKDTTSKKPSEQRLPDESEGIDLASLTEGIGNAMMQGDMKNAYQMLTQLDDELEDDSDPFYIGKAYYWKATLVERTKFNPNPQINDIKTVLLMYQVASANFEKTEDFAGAGLCLDRIGVIYQNALQDHKMARAFYTEAVKLYAKAMENAHPLRANEEWCASDSLTHRIKQLNGILAKI